MDAAMPRDLQVRNHLRWLVDEAGLRTLFSSVCFDARQFDDDPVRPQCRCEGQGADVPAHPDRFFIATRLARGHLAPKPAEHFPFDIWHGYHFDSVLLGQFLHRKALQRGVRYKTAHVTHANLDERGAIASVGTREGETIAADIFVDCSGFAGLLIDQALHTPFVSFAENLFNDAAIAIPTPLGAALPSETVSTAMRHGWAWKIPLTERYGNGYVYSTQSCSPDQAEKSSASARTAGFGHAGAPSQNESRTRHAAIGIKTASRSGCRKVSSSRSRRRRCCSFNRPPLRSSSFSSAAISARPHTSSSTRASTSISRERATTS